MTRLRTALTTEVLLACLLQALPFAAHAQAHSRSLIDTAECASDRYRSVHNWTNRDVDIALAVCLSGASVGSAAYIEYWRSTLQTCAAGDVPKALIARAQSVPFVRANSLDNLGCEDVFKLAKRIGLSGDVERSRNERAAVDVSRAQALELLRRNAAGGSPSAKFLLATSLLDIENANHVQVSKTREGLNLLASMAKEGYANEVTNYVAGMERKFPASPNSDRRHQVYMYIYGGLARADDPRGHVRLAEEKLRTALAERKRGPREAMLSDAISARQYLAKAKLRASGDLLMHVEKLDRAAAELENSPTSGQVLSSAIISGLCFAGTWQQAGGEAAMKRWEDCRTNRPAADLDPTLRLAWSFFGCYAY